MVVVWRGGPHDPPVVSGCVVGRYHDRISLKPLGNMEPAAAEEATTDPPVTDNAEDGSDAVENAGSVPDDIAQVSGADEDEAEEDMSSLSSESMEEANVDDDEMPTEAPEPAVEPEAEPADAEAEDEGVEKAEEAEEAEEVGAGDDADADAGAELTGMG